MSFLQRVKEMLGLADEYYDDEYDDDFRDDDDEEDPRDHTSRSVYRSPYSEKSSARHLDRDPDPGRTQQASSPKVQMHIVELKSFSEAQVIADKFKMNIPVIMNMTVLDPDLAKRFIDFASGLTYGLDGGLQKISDRVFMLTPANVAVSDIQRRDLRERGLFSLDI